MAFDEVDEMFKRLMSNKGMKGMLVINQAGVLIKSNMEQELAVQITALIDGFMTVAKRDVRIFGKLVFRIK